MYLHSLLIHHEIMAYSMEYSEQVSINAPPHKEVCCFSAKVDVSSSQYGCSLPRGNLNW